MLLIINKIFATSDNVEKDKHLNDLTQILNFNLKDNLKLELSNIVESEIFKIPDDSIKENTKKDSNVLSNKLAFMFINLLKNQFIQICKQRLEYDTKYKEYFSSTIIKENYKKIGEFLSDLNKIINLGNTRSGGGYWYDEEIQSNSLFYDITQDKDNKNKYLVISRNPRFEFEVTIVDCITNDLQMKVIYYVQSNVDYSEQYYSYSIKMIQDNYSYVELKLVVVGEINKKVNENKKIEVENLVNTLSEYFFLKGKNAINNNK